MLAKMASDFEMCIRDSRNVTRWYLPLPDPRHATSDRPTPATRSLSTLPLRTADIVFAVPAGLLLPQSPVPLIRPGSFSDRTGYRPRSELSLIHICVQRIRDRYRHVPGHGTGPDHPCGQFFPGRCGMCTAGLRCGKKDVYKRQILYGCLR